MVNDMARWVLPPLRSQKDHIFAPANEIQIENLLIHVRNIYFSSRVAVSR